MSNVAIVRLNAIQNIKLGSLFEFLNSDTMSSFSDDSCYCYSFFRLGKFYIKIEFNKVNI